MDGASHIPSYGTTRSWEKRCMLCLSAVEHGPTTHIFPTNQKNTKKKIKRTKRRSATTTRKCKRRVPRFCLAAENIEKHPSYTVQPRIGCDAV